MAVSTFIPKLWDARLLQGLQKNLVYANLMNRSYEGQITQMGDTVKINFLGDITVSTYAPGTAITAQTLDTTSLDLAINKSDYFNFQVDDIEKVQARADLIGPATANASYKLADKADISLAADLAASGTIVTGLGTTATPLVVTPTTEGSTSIGAYDLLLKIKVALGKGNVPKEGRWVVVPEEFESMMLQDSRFVAVALEDSQDRLTEGTVYRAAGFNIHVSNNVPNTSGAKFKIIAGYPQSGAYADQILKTETYRVESGFKDGVKGLHVYGHKVVRPDTLAVATVNFS